MLPVTHYLYLGLGLVCVGLCGAVLRRSMIVALLGVQLMLAGAALCLCAYGRVFFDPGAQAMAGLVVLVGLCELAVAAAVILRSARYDSSRRGEGSQGEGEGPQGGGEGPDAGAGEGGEHGRGEPASLIADWTLGGRS